MMLASCAYYLSCIYPHAENHQELDRFSDLDTVTVRPFGCVPNAKKSPSFNSVYSSNKLSTSERNTFQSRRKWLHSTLWRKGVKQLAKIQNYYKWQLLANLFQIRRTVDLHNKRIRLDRRPHSSRWMTNTLSFGWATDSLPYWMAYWLTH
jgi:hypothetical protein